MWARAITLTRQNQIPGAIGTTLALIPLYDLFNHALGGMETCFDVETQCSETTTREIVRPGDQMFIMYGQRPNQDLLLFSGFVDPNMVDFDVVKIHVSLNVNDIHYERRVMACEKAGLKR